MSVCVATSRVHASVCNDMHACICWMGPGKDISDSKHSRVSSHSGCLELSLMGCGVFSVKTSGVPARVKPLVCSPTLASFPDFLAHLIIEEMPHTLTAH